MLTPRISTRSNPWVRELLQDLKMFVFVLAVIFASRVAVLLTFRSQIADTTTFADVLFTLGSGVLFDLRIACLALPVPVLLTFMGLRLPRLRRAVGAVMVGLSVVLAVVTVGYFAEFGAQFDYHMWDLYYDSLPHIASMLWADYHPLRYLAAAAGLSAGLIWLMFRWLSREPTWWPRLPRRALTFVVCMAVLVLGLRGSVSARPLNYQDSGVTTDPFLNKLELNAYFALYYCIKNGRDVAKVAQFKLYIPDGDIRAAFRRTLSTEQDLDAAAGYLARTAAGPKLDVTPQHIFLVLMESYEAWPTFERFAPLGLTRELEHLGDNGIMLDNFLPASHSTGGAVGAILLGLPDADTRPAYQQTSSEPYPTALGATFQRLGYRTRLFYGGYTTWHRLHDFATAQGFQDVYGAAHMGLPPTSRKWKVEDESIFQFVEETIPANEKTFTVVLTTTFHPPYDLDVFEMGAPRLDHPDARMLGHLWYSDQQLGKFVRSVSAKLDDALFVITGDHSDRRTITSDPDLRERLTVPLVFYAPGMIDELDAPVVAGSQNDLSATLIELVAPAGFRYHAIGQDLFTANDDHAAIGHFRAAWHNRLIRFGHNNAFEVWGEPLDDETIRRLRRRHDDMHGIAWWLSMKGDQLTADSATRK